MTNNVHSFAFFASARDGRAAPPGISVSASSAVADPNTRLRTMVDSHYDAVWRTVRFFGTPDAIAEDAAQQVFCIAARKLAEIEFGAERAFLLSTAWHVASEGRRTARRRPVTTEGDFEAMAGFAPSPEDLLDRKQARAELQTVLDAMSPDLRKVFVLFEVEDFSVPEIAAATGAPVGTVTSRLRRAREQFQSIVKRRSAAGLRSAVGDRL